MPQKINKVLRTPDVAFAPLGDFPYIPNYYTTHLFCEEGVSLRMAYIDEGPKDAKETLLLTHGEPSWSYLYRRMIPLLTQHGYRCIAPDLIGFGRSDKPLRDEDFSYERHIAWLTDLVCNHLDLYGMTAVFQDWGGLLGLRVAANHSNRFDRLVISNTFLPTCDDSFFQIKEGFYNWKKNAPKLVTMPIGTMMIRASKGPKYGELTEAEQYGYSCPFPTNEYKAGARMFPELVPTPSTDPTGRPQSTQAENNKAAWNVFKGWTKPVLLAFR
jgi:haloalkane dehalogenase